MNRATGFVGIVAVLVAVGLGLYILIRPDGGLLYDNPTLVVAVGMIGLGLCRCATGLQRQ